MSEPYHRADPDAVIRNSKYELMIMHKWVVAALNKKCSEEQRQELETLKNSTSPFAKFNPNK